MASTIGGTGNNIEHFAELLRAPGALAIADRIETGVRSGDLPAGQRLPPIRSLARHIGVDANTVAAAYRTARDRGLVETAGRAGTRVRARPTAVAREALGPAVPTGGIDLSHGSPDPALLPPLLLPSADPWPVGYLEARSVLLHDRLREVATERFAADGLPDGALTAASGACDGIERVLAARLRPGDRIAVEDPGWSSLLDLLGILGYVLEPLICDDEGPLPGSLVTALAAGAAAVVLTSRAQNPTGSALSSGRAADLRPLLEAAPETLLIEDDHGGDLSAVQLATLAGSTDSWVYLRSASKAFGPDLRCAVLLGDEVTIGRVAGRLRLGPGWVSHLLQHATAEAWSRQSAAAATAGRVYDRRRDALLQALERRSIRAQGRTGLNVWVPVPDEATAVAGLLVQGYAVAPGSRYRLASGPGVRISTSLLEVDKADEVADAVRVSLRPAGRPGSV